MFIETINGIAGKRDTDNETDQDQNDFSLRIHGIPASGPLKQSCAITLLLLLSHASIYLQITNALFTIMVSFSHTT